MSKLKERVLHGTPSFPVGIYKNRYSDREKDIVSMHFHTEFEFFAVKSGEFLIQTLDGGVELGEGDGIFINSGAVHSITPISAGEYEFIAIVFLPEFLASENEKMYEKYILNIKKGNIKMPEKLNTHIIEMIFDTYEQYLKKPLGYEFAIKGNLMNMMYECIKDSKIIHTQSENSKEKLVKNVIDYIHQHYEKQITLKELADYVHISKEYLCRIFAEVSDDSPIVYLNRYRVVQSADMLLNSHKTISEIASLCGFNSNSYFDKMFMRFVGLSPKEYRKQK